MYTEIGKKLKSLAKSTAWVGIIICIIWGIAMLVESFDDTYSIYDNLKGTRTQLQIKAIAIMVLGSLISGVLSWVLYGFGELIDTNMAIARNTRALRGNTGYDDPEVTEAKLNALESLYFDYRITKAQYDYMCNEVNKKADLLYDMTQIKQNAVNEMLIYMDKNGILTRK